MGTIFSRGKPRGRVIPILALCFVIVISVGIFLYHDRIAQLGYYGYPSVFLISVIWNSTVIYPVPSFWIYYPLGSIFFPPLLGLTGGAGAAIGELTGYMAGYSGRGILQRQRGYARAEHWVKRWGAPIIFGFNLVPFFPYDLAGIAAGALRYPLWKFFLLCLAGRSSAYIIVACVGAGWIQLPFLNPP
jgi:membrane protein YqaA with SNARE-associated domain